MSAPLPPYDPAATCSKCGHDVASSVYRRPCGDPNCKWVDHQERITRTCQRCSFQWDEAVLPTQRLAP